MKEFFSYVLEFMITFDKMQNTIPLMCTNFEIREQNILKVIQSFHTICIILYIGCSDPVVECLNKINLLQSTTRQLQKNKMFWPRLLTPLHVFEHFDNVPPVTNHAVFIWCEM